MTGKNKSYLVLKEWPCKYFDYDKNLDVLRCVFMTTLYNRIYFHVYTP